MVGFEKVLKSCVLLPVALSGLIDIFCTVVSLKILAMIVYDIKGTKRYLAQTNFL